MGISNNNRLLILYTVLSYYGKHMVETNNLFPERYRPHDISIQR